MAPWLGGCSIHPFRAHHDTPHKVVIGFDLDCVGVLYNGATVYALPRAIRALTWRRNVVDLTRRSTTYEACRHQARRGARVLACQAVIYSPTSPRGLDRLQLRLYKYSQRGFEVVIPMIDPELIVEPTTCR